LLSTYFWLFSKEDGGGILALDPLLGLFEAFVEVFVEVFI
jgi:hypothetical protein